MEDLHEYIVTLKNFDDLDSFYDDMETPGGSLYIPDRTMPVYRRRLISKNTHYMLTHEEANLIKNDSRVVGVEMAERIRNSIKPCWTTPSQTFRKSISVSGDVPHNWALKRCTDGVQTTGWGLDGTEDSSGIVSVGLSGKNVDVVIIDGHINPGHPTFSVNTDGTGGSRVNQFNWFLLNSIVDVTNDLPSGVGMFQDDYVYTPYDGPGSAGLEVNNHGCHVAGTVAGNENGWARDANIYNFNNHVASNTQFDYGLELTLWDYIRAFHNSKSINPATGFKNPTICNCSYSGSEKYPNPAFDIGPITRVVHRGTTIGDGINALTSEQLSAAGIYNVNGVATVPLYSTAADSDIQQAIADGVIIVAGAGNAGFYMDKPGSPDYDNMLTFMTAGSTVTRYYHRGGQPGGIEGVITVGAVGAAAIDKKANYSNTGPAISIFAPGTNIISSVNASSVNYVDMPDQLNNSFRNGFLSGTSMASPQVCGVLACVLEAYPNMTQDEAMRYIKSHAKVNQLAESSGGTQDSFDLQGAPNLYLYVYPERPATNSVYPKVNYKLRPTTGKVYPRVKTRVYK